MAFAFSDTDRFQVIRKLGEGGMGVVYEAFDRERGTRVALKTLRTWSADSLLRFKREFREFQHISHPNLVSLGELFEDGDQWFFTMELIDGIDWYKFVGRGPTLKEPDLRRTLRQIVDGLSALHHDGKVHRDIKPTNVLVTNAGRAVLLDYGLATELPSEFQPTSTSIVGTPAYMAPEQLDGQRVGPPADWYSVGVMLYEAMTGKLPFTGTPLRMGEQKLLGAYAKPATLVPGLPPDLCRLCEGLLDANPDRRPIGAEIFTILGHTADGSHTCESISPKTDDVPTPFIGRRPELEYLHAVVSKTIETREGQALVLYGESGIGKTATVDQFQKEIGQRYPNAIILNGRCYERESIPFNAIDGVIDSLSRVLSRLPALAVRGLLPEDAVLLPKAFPVMARISEIATLPVVSSLLEPQELRTRIFRALKHVVKSLADLVPVLMTIDDIQWSDADSVLFLDEFFRGSKVPAITLICAFRGASVDPSKVPHVARQLWLPPLDDAASEELATAILARTTNFKFRDVRRVVQEAGGHPLFLNEIARHLASSDVERTIPPVTSFAIALSERLGRLEPALADTLHAIAVSPAPLSEVIIGRLSGLSDADSNKRLKSLRRDRWIHPGQRDGHRHLWEPYHDRIRKVICDRLPDASRGLLHRRIAAIFESLAIDDPETLAVHWNEGGDHVRAAMYQNRAGDKAARSLAFDRAAHFYKLCLDSSRTENGDVAVVDDESTVVKLAQALGNAGCIREAADMYTLAIPLAAEEFRLELRWRLTNQLLTGGYIDEGLANVSVILLGFGMTVPRSMPSILLGILIETVVAWVRRMAYREGRPRELARYDLLKLSTCWSAAMCVSLIDTLLGYYFQAVHLSSALKLKQKFHVANNIAMKNAYLSALGKTSSAVLMSRVRASETILGEEQQPYNKGLFQLCYGMINYFAEDWNAALRLFQTAETIFSEECIGVTWEVTSAKGFILCCLHHLGQFRALQTVIPSLLTNAEEKGDAYFALFLRTYYLNSIWLCEDNPARAHAEVKTARKQFISSRYTAANYESLIAEFNIGLYEQESPVSMEKMLEADWPKMEAVGFLRVHVLRAQALAMRMHTAVGLVRVGRRTRQSLRAANRTIRSLERGRLIIAHGLAAIGRAAIHDHLGSATNAIVSLLRAEDIFARLEMKAHVAACQMRRGYVLGGAAGALLIATGAKSLSDEAVVKPEKLIRVLAPGFPDL